MRSLASPLPSALLRLVPIAGALAASCVVACSSSSSSPSPGSGNDAGGRDGSLGDGSVTADGAVTDARASSEDATDSAPDASWACPGVPLVPDATGTIATNAVGVVGSWYSYVDCNDYLYFDSGTPNPGVNCSRIDAPTGGTFAPQPGSTSKMCTKGTTVTVDSSADWQTHWGAGIGLDLNNSGTKADYDASANRVVGFCFVLSGNTIPSGLKVNLPSDQNITDNWYFETESTPGVKTILFSDKTLKQTTATSTPFDPTKLQSIQFQIAATMSAPVAWDFCVDQLTAIIGTPATTDAGSADASSADASGADASRSDASGADAAATDGGASDAATDAPDAADAAH